MTLISIDNKLSGLDARVALIEVLHKEFQHLHHSLEFSQKQIDTLTQENKSLHHSVSKMFVQLSSVTTQLSHVTSENKSMKETILDLQSHYGLNDQYPPEINNRRKQLFPIRKQMIQKGKRAVISVDKLYIDGQLFKDKDITPWLF
ncbi:hypothetical protein N1851_023262 [Merluccius polli]|uniref:Uncharacterized protein n=1 Tax=Merluccius polli TaxID=89951 RepID=A0AA47MGU3_MERPO|nr:hypothetical protein N1851_023262 [Merluccius polli]